jgi:hypothetical protein
MNLELSRIEVSEANSEETWCYSAIVLLDKKPIGHVKNAGHGGADITTVPDTILAQINQWLETSRPPAFTIGEKSFLYDFELWCAEEVQQFVTRRELRRQMKRNVLFIHEKQVWETKCAADGIENTIRRVKAKHGQNTKILNDMPFEQALKEYVEATTPKEQQAA